MFETQECSSNKQEIMLESQDRSSKKRSQERSNSKQEVMLENQERSGKNAQYFHGNSFVFQSCLKSCEI
jgi:hypothetical protein